RRTQARRSVEVGRRANLGRPPSRLPQVPPREAAHRCRDSKADAIGTRLLIGSKVMMSTTLFTRLALTVLSLAAATSGTMAADVSLMVGGIEKQIYLPVTLAQQLGYFRDEGISVEILSEPAGVEAADEMLAGAVQGVVGFYDHTIQLQSLGKFTESVVQL